MHSKQQSGAALVIGLILLLVLTLLAVSGMSSASLEFIMAGNEQYRANAFAAAEAGIEQSIKLGQLIPGAAAELRNGATTPTDTWSSQITSPLGANATDPPAGFNSNMFVSYHFEVQSTGASTRGAQAISWQGVQVVAPADSSRGADSTLPTNQLN